MQWPRLTTLAKTEGLKGRIIALWANCIDPQETSSTILVRPLMLWLFLRGRHGVMASSSYQFSQHSLRSVGSCEYTSAAKAFIFSLHNVHGYKPVKLAQNRYQGCVIYRCNSYGPTFGGYPTQNPSTYTVVSFQLTKNSILPVQPTLSRSLLQKFPV